MTDTTETKAAPKRAKKAASNSYDASSIQVLKGLDAVRKRPGMYVGGTGSDGLQHLLWELIDNSIDEASAGHASKIDVTFRADGAIGVADDGRGIPIGKKKGGKTALELVFTELHAGGKFGGGAYAASGGLHGVGASVVNALSSRLIAEVDIDGHTHRLCFRDQVAGQEKADGTFAPGKALAKTKKIGATRTGTRVWFWPDYEIFDPEAVIDFELVRERLARMSFLVPGVKISLTDARPDSIRETETFMSKGGLADYVDLLSIGESVTGIISIQGSGTFTEKVPVDGKMTEVERTCDVDIAMRWVNGYETKVVSFVNTIPTSAGGTHITGFDRGLNKAVNDVLLADAKKLAKLAKDGKDKAQREDVQEGLVAAVKVTFAEPQFRGQTKQELGTPAIRTIVYDVIKDGMTTWANGGGAKKHITAARDKIASAVVNRVLAKQALDAKRKAANLSGGAMPDKLADCRIHGPDAELLIVEGDSAAGPAKAGRSAEYMAVLPLRGKVVNAAKASLKQVIENAEAQALFTAIGAGSGREFDIRDARYGRIIILCDADVDGSHIRCLLLTLIYRYMRPLLEGGHVYAAQPPLFSTKVRGAVHYAYSDEERDALTKKLTAKREDKTLAWVRFKGLGEMDVDELAETTLDPDKRILRRLTMNDAAEAERAADRFEVLMGTDVSRRKEFLLANSSLINPDRLDV